MFKILLPEQIAKVKKIGLPIRNCNAFLFGQPFGANWVNFYKELGMRGHNGIDFSVPNGTPVIACFDGKVTVAGLDSQGGHEIRLESNEFEVEGQKMKLEAIYYHLLRETISKDKIVKKGDEIAMSDNTGRYTTGPHLHFGIKILYKSERPGELTTYEKDYQNGYSGAVNPEPLFDRNDYQLLPVDSRYGQQKSLAREWIWKAKSWWWVVRKLGRKPKQREINAWVYGCWDYDFVMEPSYFIVWTQDTKAEFKLKNKN